MVFKQQTDDVDLARAGRVVQRRPARFVHVRPFFDHFLHQLKLALDGGQHQRAFTLHALGVQVGFGPVDQQLGDFGGGLSQGSCQATLALRVQRVGVKATRQQPLCSLCVITFDSLKKVFVRARKGHIQTCKSHEAY